MPVFEKRATHFEGDLIRPEDVLSLQLSQAKSGVWYASRLDHPVIEVSLSTGKVDGGKLPSSRLYYTKTYQYGLGPLKSHQFLDWADRIFRVAKRFFQHRNANGYVGEKAQQWLSKGGQIANW